MKPKVYPALFHAVEDGVRCGYKRAFKDENPLEEVIIDSIRREVLAAIIEWFDLEDGE